MSNQEDTILNDIWTVYFHDPYDTNWNTNSYMRLGSISSVEEYWHHHLSMKSNVHKAMFFIMRDHVFPMWDDPLNLEGGCLSIKVLKENMAEFWDDLCKRSLGETLITNEYAHLWNDINGISTSPKKHFCIIKIWIKNEKLSSKEFFNLLPLYYGDIIYKSNLDNINNDNNKDGNKDNNKEK